MIPEDLCLPFHGEYSTHEDCVEDIILYSAQSLSSRLRLPVEALRSQIYGQWKSLHSPPLDSKHFEGEVQISHLNDPEMGSSWVGEIIIFLTGEDDETLCEAYSGLLALLVVH